ncbi:MAG: hypothetical protein D6707_01080, partial [Bacteroidetes bacterium]
MKKFYLFLIAVFCFFHTQAQDINDPYYPRYKKEFEKVYQLYPDIPKGILQAVAFTNTRVFHLEPSRMAPSCIGLPEYFGVMGLVEDGKNYFRNNLKTVSQLSGISVSDIKTSPYYNILAYAKAFHKVANQMGIQSTRPEDYLPVLVELSELPLDTSLVNNFALNADLYMNLVILNDKKFQIAYDLPSYAIDLRSVFAEKYDILSATNINLDDLSVKNPSGGNYQFQNRAPASCSMPNGPAQYPSALWDAADPSNYSGAISPYMIAIHTIQGKYSGAISWFKNPSANVSCQYVMRSYDGQVTQMVCHRIKAWHVGSQNPYAVGIEHEGYIESGLTWYTDALYQASADLSKFIAAEESVNKLQTYDGPPTNGLMTLSNSCHKIKGHQHFPDNTHVDPGPYWNWERYYRLVNDMPAPTASSTASSGTMYDSGGASGNYSDEERTVYLIDPVGNDPVQLTFTQWDVEDGWDFLWIYDGTDDTGNLIGKYSGTSPGTVTAYSGAVFMEFRSDCATNGAGWTVNWNTVSMTACGIPTNLTENSVDAFTASLSWDNVPGATQYRVQYKGGLETSWHEVITNTNSVNLTGLYANELYDWRVQTICGTDTSAFQGDEFATPQAGSTLVGSASYSSSECSGKFYDSGGGTANYSNYEDWTYTIAPPGAANITVTFNSFDIESGYDYLYIYDGPSSSSPLIGSYTGTSSPGTVVSSLGAITFKFYSDNWTNKPGWDADWVCNSSGGSTSLPETQLSALNAWYNDDFTVTFTDTDNSGTGLQETFYLVAQNDGSNWNANASEG